MDEVFDPGLFDVLQQKVNEVHANVTLLEHDFQSLKWNMHQSNAEFRNCFVVPAGIMKKLQQQVSQITWNMNACFTPQFLNILRSIPELETHLAALIKANTALKVDLTYWQSQSNGMLEKYLQEKEEKILLWDQLQETTQHLSVQSDFCSQLGSICCTLLWKASQSEEVVLLLLRGVGGEKLLQLIAATLRSYTIALQDNHCELKEDNKDFVVALCGIITNIAAVAEGRQFIHRYSMLSELSHVLLTITCGPSSAVSEEMKKLCVMALFNISIDKRGQVIISSKADVAEILADVLKNETDMELTDLCLRLIASLMFEQDNPLLLDKLNGILARFHKERPNAFVGST